MKTTDKHDYIKNIVNLKYMIKKLKQINEQPNIPAQWVCLRDF